MRFQHWIFFLVIALCPSLGMASPVGSGTSSAAVVRRSSGFSVPKELRPRVNFWIDVFTKYGKDQLVVHHRQFPQIVFGVLDFSAEARELNENSLARLKKARAADAVDELKAALRRLGDGHAPSSVLEERIVSKMEFLRGGERKYRAMLNDDLIRTQTGIREKYIESVKRSGRYLPHIERIFREQGLPVELTRLPYIESSFDYQAYSSVGAAGIWQFMPRTGRTYMTVNSVVDERRDPIAASYAAAKYLKTAYNTLKSWPLAITSYNHGVAGVGRKAREMGTFDIIELIENQNKQVFGFASNNFYPEFLAALEIHENVGLYFPNIEVEPVIKFVEHRLVESVSMRHILNTLNIDEHHLRRLNYSLADSVWKGRVKVPRGYVLKVPPETGDMLTLLRKAESRGASQPTSSSTIYGGVVYTVRAGDNLGKIAKKFGVSIRHLMAQNDLPSTTVRVGQRLVIKAPENETPKEVAATKSAPTAPARTSTARSYTVRSGDSLWSISRRYNVSKDTIRRMNGLRSDTIKIGQKLRLP